ncbi:MAG: hypothetical protein LBB43_06215 [Spirochaetaceae bacterium]|jgi:hypothetical protein|nr:hypothetical protein [Spirochaetaceae bacterium]
MDIPVGITVLVALLGAPAVIMFFVYKIVKLLAENGKIKYQIKLLKLEIKKQKSQIKLLEKENKKHGDIINKGVK